MKKKFKFIPRKLKLRNLKIIEMPFEKVLAINIAEHKQMVKWRAERDHHINCQIAF
jgi:hypothetical protein